MRTTTTTLVLCVFALASCGPFQHRHPDRAHELATWMSGEFSSAAQAKHDPSYFTVRMAMAPVWTAREDGPWLYIEQAVASDLNRPYRQRIYHLVNLEDGGVRSDVYELPQPAAFIDAWRTPERFASLTPDDLTLRRGCSIWLRRAGDAYVGSTHEQDCESSLRGASYATSEVRVEPGRLTSWDRGFDRDGKQVWGAVDGAYVFERAPNE